MIKKVRMLQGDIDKNNEKIMRYLEKSVESRTPHAGGNRKFENVENSL